MMRNNLFGPIVGYFCTSCILLCALVACDNSEESFNQEIDNAYFNVIVEQDVSYTKNLNFDQIYSLEVFPQDGEYLHVLHNLTVDECHAFYKGTLPRNSKYVLWGWQYQYPDTYEEAVMNFDKLTQHNVPDEYGNKYTYSRNTMYMVGECRPATDSRCDADVVMKHLTLDLSIQMTLPKDYLGTINAVRLSTVDESMAFTLKKYLAPELSSQTVTHHSITLIMEDYKQGVSRCECRINLLPFVLHGDKLKVVLYTRDESGKIYSYSQIISTEGMQFEAGHSYMLNAEYK